MLNRKITVLFGSQTGNAQEIAERIWREAKRYYFTGPIQAMDDFPVSELIFENLVVFVCSTTGQGEEPDNMKQFWKFLLRKNLPSDSLSTMKYAVLGLGDSSYIKFNYAAKKLNRRLLQLGGYPFLEVGLGDDQHDLGVDAVVEPWIQNLWVYLSKAHPLPDGVLPVSEDIIFPPRWQVHFIDPKVISLRESWNEFRNQVAETFTENTPYIVTVSKNERTTAPTHFQDVRLIKLEASRVNYSPGDVLMVCPCNLEENVNQFLSILSSSTVIQVNLDSVIKLKETDKYAPVPEKLKHPFTLRKCVQQYWDLNAIPKRSFFHLLSHFTTSELEKEKLMEFTTAEGQEELYNYCNRPRRTILEVLQDFPHATANISLEYMFELLPPIRPRAFSIASSPKAHVGEIHILVAVVKYQTKLVKPRVGLCSNWLASLTQGSTIPIWIRKGSFRFPQSDKFNVSTIMIGPGTGVAPFRSYIHERVALHQASDKSLFLFFGCRNKNGDFHFAEEWHNFQKAGKISIFCAFSRDQEHKVYVQHRIKEQADLLWTLLSSGASIFLAGSSKNMPAAVREAFIVNVVQGTGKHTLEDAERFFKSLENSGRYQSETWS